MNTLLFLDVSGGELLVIILVVFLVFGPSKMPEITRKMGKWMNELKRASNQITREFNQGTSDIRKEVSKVQSQIISTTDNIEKEINSTRQTVARNVQFDLNEEQAKAQPAPSAPPDISEPVKE